MQTKTIFGLDIGGSGIKGAVVDVGTGELTTERGKIATPQPSTPAAVAESVADLLRQVKYDGDLIGCGFPSIVKHGVSHSAANVDAGWMGTNIEELLSKATGKRVIATNDADAAGLAEMRYGKGHGVKGTVLLITIGTGLGSALFTDGHLVRNTEFGHCTLHGMIAEQYVSNTARKKYNLTWEDFGKRFNEFLHLVDRLCSPDLIILGGGVSNDFDLFSPYIDVNTSVTTAMMFNHAGIIGAALYAYETVAAEAVLDLRP
jgi:polyphosphate glucokinase